MDFMQLEYFCTVAKTKNITRAADLLLITQPSLSQIIGRMERELAVPLVRRASKGIELTEAGKRFHEFALRVLREQRDVVREMRDLENKISGGIHVRANAMSYVIARLYCDFRRLYPDVTIHFTAERVESGANASRNPRLFSEDLLVTTNAVVPDYAGSADLATEELFAALPPGHPLQSRASLRLEELAGDSFLVFQGGELRNIIENYCKVAGFQPQILMECSNTNTLFGLVASGMGVTLFPRSWRRMYNDNIASVPISEPRCTRTIRLLWGSDRYMSKSVSAFRDYIIQHVDRQLNENFF